MTVTPNAIDLMVGENIKSWRLKRGMTVLFVASSLGVGAATLGSMEAGLTRIGADHLQSLCTLLEIAPAAVYASSTG